MDRENNQSIKPFLMFLCSLLPGCAHMYLGLMKRGLQLLLAFVLLIGCASAFYGLGFILVPIIIVLYVYSFFDGYSIFRNVMAGKTVEDESVIEGLDPARKILINGYWIGLALIVFGLIAAFQNIRFLPIFRESFYEYFRMVQNFTPAAILLILGIVLMAKGNKQRKINKEEKQREIS